MVPVIWLVATVAVGGTHDAEVIELLAQDPAWTEARREQVQQILSASDRMGFGEPSITKHPMDAATCRARREEAGLTGPDPANAAICGHPWMAPLYDPATQTAADAKVCIDQFEFPNVPCSYPLIWVRAAEAQQLCSALGKRLCDAHEWEGACAGSVGPAAYPWELASGKSDEAAVRAMREANNASAAQAWAYGPEFQKGVCAAASTKSPGCDGSDWRQCGSNTYPTGAFPGCVSALGVYDQHGNAAEHMNLPLDATQLSAAGGSLGVTEMKGSWFIWDTYRAHEDWCLWRAPFWHGGKVMAADSHRNYHLSFRCCADVEPR